ncbi:DUF4097 family beta strand repeat-containing protein [Pseudonocardia eucalypti]|uniref:DUF4097 family beta strand repeat-containing protein n=1 Tax=Pseudonocardia eucalypti TaxID=648755 RepID=A0ABP9QV27_9PSEU|nr:hypothetical protein [Pseudonocardia eucalypti]
MTEDSTPPQDTPEQPENTERTERWDCSGPAELDLSLDVGRIEVALDEAVTSVRLTLRADEHGGGWTRGLSGVLGWINEVTGPSGSIRIGNREFNLRSKDLGFGGPDIDLTGLAGSDLGDEAVRATEVRWSEPRLVVRSPSTLPLRIVPLVLTVAAPAQSRITLRTGAGDITVTGPAGTASVNTVSGSVELDDVAGNLEVGTGSGRATVGAVAGRLQAKTASGDLSLAEVHGPAQLRTGSGDLRLGLVRADLHARTASGDLVVQDAEAGTYDLTTGSGNLRVGVHAGVAARLDLRSGSGQVRSDLDVNDSAPPSGGSAKLDIHGRTGSGDVLVTRALSAAAS